MRKFKQCTAFKVAPDAGDTGRFEAIVSVFGNTDVMGDVVQPGAFADTLAEWAASGDPIPVLWSHRMDDPRFCIGAVTDAAELGAGDPRIPEWADEWVKGHGGLWVAAQLDTDANASDVAVAARKLLRQRLVTQFSFAYDVLDGGWGVVDGEDVYELRKLRVFEVSPCYLGANDLTELLGGKASELIKGLPESVRGPARAKVRDAMAILAKALVAYDVAEPDEPDEATEPAGPSPAQIAAIVDRFEFDAAMDEFAEFVS